MKAISRREFLTHVATLAGGACCYAALGSLGGRYAFGQALDGGNKAAVFLNQFGGCDPLNSFAIPRTLSAYYDRRPTIAIPQSSVLSLSGTSIGFHPALLNLQRMFNAGDVALINGIGDPEGTRSHFTSQDIFSRGTTEKAPSDTRGWIGRLGDLYFDSVELNTLAIGVGNKVDLLSNRSSNTPLAVSDIGSVGYDRLRTDGLNYHGEAGFQAESMNKMTSQGNPDTDSEEAVDKSRDVFADAISELNEAQSNYSPSATFPNSAVGSYLKQVSTVVSYGLGTKVFYGGIGGWDHHSEQGGAEGRQAGLLLAVDGALGAFEAEMKAKGHWNKVTICIFTEFGRKTFENSSGGTDHGWGSTMVLLGGGVKGGVYGTTHTESDLTDRSWLYQDIDFRNPFSEIISWLGYDPTPVFPQTYVKDNFGLLS